MHAFLNFARLKPGTVFAGSMDTNFAYRRFETGDARRMGYRNGRILAAA
jgi:hypothetical protein